MLFRSLKVYMMVGLPGETDGDVDELVRFTRELSAVCPVSLGVAPFVAKRNTPLDGEGFGPSDVVAARLRRLRRGLQGHAVVRPTSVRWAYVEYLLAQGGAREGEAVLRAVDAGGSCADFERELERAWRDAGRSPGAPRPAKAAAPPSRREFALAPAPPA